MRHTMYPLPYALDELSPQMSTETLQFHHGKHLQTYVDNLNKLIAGTYYEDMELEELICKATGPIYNNAAQTWNHVFFFEALTPHALGMPDELSARLIKHFKSINEFKDQLLGSAAGLFGSGWTWLVEDKDDNLRIVNTSNADNPLRNEMKPLFTIDVWEHAYYIDYRNRRAEYLQAVWDLANWQVVAQRLQNAECNVYL